MRRNRGLTLVEIIVVIAILGLIKPVAMPAVNNHSVMDSRLRQKQLSNFWLSENRVTEHVFVKSHNLMISWKVEAETPTL